MYGYECACMNPLGGGSHVLGNTVAFKSENDVALGHEI